MVWMHPPVHRVLGLITKESNLSLSRNVWRLNQIAAITKDQVFIKGKSAYSDQSTLEQFPTLINANILNKKSQKLGSIVDLVFESMTGKILYYLISRSNPKLPGTSRWSFKIDHITDQQPGAILSNLNSLDDLPLVKASIKEEFLQKSRHWKTQIEDITNKASNRLEGWLEESPWEESETRYNNISDKDLNNWVDDFKSEKQLNNEYNYSKQKNSDPWV